MYDPKPAHMFYPTLAFVAGTASALNDLNTLSIAMYIIGGILIAWIALAGALAPIIELIREKRMQMDSAKNLDLDRMAALGLTSNPIKESINVRITSTDRSGNFEREEMIYNLPISPVKLATLANHIINGGTFSRPELVEARGLFTDPEYRKLKDVFKDRGIVALKNKNNANAGYEVTRAGLAFFRNVIDLPSPTPTMDLSENAV